VSIAEPASQIDDAVADKCPVRAASGCRKANKFHGASSLGEISPFRMHNGDIDNRENARPVVEGPGVRTTHMNAGPLPPRLTAAR